ncbi:MAG TPA: peptidyl-prolyl cis-trans isomerase [Kofleriaceae bacterium]|nr:peptidyl-prolyl cis-trans isomerase [Kofleriaceae bacterium]
MIHSRSFFVGAVVGFSAAAVSLGYLGCQRNKEDKAGSVDELTKKDVPALPPQNPTELAQPLAKVDDVTITVGEFQDRINKQSPYIRARYTSLEQKKEFLDNLIRFEVLAKEALRRGFDKNPDVVRTMKQVMIQKLMKDEFENKLKPEDIPDAEMKTFYEAHKDEYNKAEEVRVSAIVLRSQAQAKAATKEAQGEAGRTNKAFRDLVSKYSTDDKSKVRGGDLRYFSATSPDVPAPVIKAAFALAQTGDVAGPIDAGNGTWYVIKQTGRRKAISKPFDSVKRQIQNRIYRDKRTQAQKDFIDNLRNKAQVKLFEDNLAKVRVDTTTGAITDPHGPGAGTAPAFPGQGEEPSDPMGVDQGGAEEPAP